MIASRKTKSGACFLLILAGLSQMGASFILRVVPADAPNVEVFTAQADADPAPEVFVLSGNSLTILLGPGSDSTINVELDEGTSAIDVADADGDGIPELYTVTGDTIQRRLLGENARNLGPEVLFSRPSLLSDSDYGPRPYVLVTQWEGRPALALPLEEGLAVFDFGGELLNLTRVTATGSRPRALDSTAIDPPQAAPADALEIRVESTFDPPSELLQEPGVLNPPRIARRGTYLQAGAAAELPPEDWPWLSLAPARDLDRRVMYALPHSKLNETLIVLRSRETRDLPGEKDPFYFSPKRRYPGRLVIPPGAAPDFNGDGYADLLLWNSPRPGSSINALMRAAQEKTWPIRLTVHLYSRIHGLYEGRPTTRIELSVPVAWSVLPLNGLPFRHLVLSDVNGDGYTDVGLATDPTHFVCWLFQPPNKFADEPDYVAELPEAIQAVKLVADMGEGSGSIIALQGKTALYLLTPPAS